MKKLLALLMAACMIFSFAACKSEEPAKTDDGGSSNTEPAGEATGTLKIGGIGPITGGAAAYGLAVQHGAEIAVEEINALGGMKIEFQMQDDEHDAEKSVNAYNTLKDWGMEVLMGTVTTNPCIAVSSKSNADKIFTLTPSASSTDVLGGQPDANGNLTVPRKKSVFQMCFTDPNQGTASAQYISSKKLGTKIAIIYNDADAYSTGIYEKFKAEAKKLGLNIVSEKSFSSDKNVDFTPHLNAAKNAGADLVFMPIYYTPASVILKQAKDMKYDVKFFGVDGLDGLLGIEGFDTTLAEDVMLLTPFAPDASDDLTKNFVAKYKEKYGETPSQFAADAYDCIYAIYNACVAEGINADTMSAADICDKLVARFTNSAFVFNGLTGANMTWSSTGEVSKAPKGMVIKNGVYVGMD